MTESEGIIKATAELSDNRTVLVIILEPIDGTLDALAVIYKWRMGERVKVIGNEPQDVKYDHTK